MNAKKEYSLRFISYSLIDSIKELTWQKYERPWRLILIYHRGTLKKRL